MDLKTKGKNFIKKALMFVLYHVFGADNEKVVFVSFNGKTYSDNPRAISEKLFELHPKADIVWLFMDPDSKSEKVPSYVRRVNCRKFRMLFELATAKVWVDNFNKPLYTFKGKSQYYIQTWHGDRGFKKTRYDSTFIRPGYRLLEEEICDLGISGSAHSERIYRSAFHYYGQVLKVGTPRNDLLVKDNECLRKDIREKLAMSPGTKVLLYAPTLRRDSTGETKKQKIQDIDLQSVIETLEAKTREKWICLIRAHVSVGALSGYSLDDRIQDVSSYEDMADLLLIADMYITDYSSSAGDFALRGKPVVLFQEDRDSYMEKDRTFYFDINDSPYLVAMNQEELLDIIVRYDDEFYKTNCQEILEFYGAVETGMASDEVAKVILDQMKLH